MNEHMKFWNEPNLSKTNVKRQHYVPQLLLRKFAINNKIRVINLENDSEFRTSIKNVALQTRFYNLKIDDIQLSTEKWLAQLEGEASPVINKLIDNPDNILSLSDKEEIHMARFLTALRFRPPAFREHQNQMTKKVLNELKDMAKQQLYYQYDIVEADKLWAQIKDKPEHWWFKSSEPQQDADITTFLLGEVQGFANVLRAAPWRTGFSQSPLTLYTSDNPISGYLRPIRTFGEGAAFASFDYFVPLSPTILLLIERKPNTKNDDGELKPRGDRRHKDYSDWEISFARHVVTSDAKKFFFGEGTIVNKECASEYINRINRATIEFSVEYLGFDTQSHFSIFR